MLVGPRAGRIVKRQSEPILGLGMKLVVFYIRGVELKPDLPPTLADVHASSTKKGKWDRISVPIGHAEPQLEPSRLTIASRVVVALHLDIGTEHVVGIGLKRDSSPADLMMLERGTSLQGEGKTALLHCVR